MIVVIGEALIDLIESREQAGIFNAVVGGANANVAFALARRGTSHQFLGRLGPDRFGTIIRERLERNGVRLDFAIAAPELTTLAVVSVDAKGSPSYSFYVNGTADWGWTLDELPSLDVLTSTVHATALHFGCLTMAMPPGNAVIEQWAKELFANETLTISHDLNMRPALGQQREPERLRVERLNSICHIIKASDEDIEWLYNLSSGANLDDIVDEWIGQTARVVVITRGGKGASLYRRPAQEKDAVHSSGAPQGKLLRHDIPGRQVKVVDTVGAGDTFCAHFLGQLADVGALGEKAFERLAQVSNEALQTFIRVANVAASITCERAGCEPPTILELQAIISSLR